MIVGEDQHSHTNTVERCKRSTTFSTTIYCRDPSHKNKVRVVSYQFGSRSSERLKNMGYESSSKHIEIDYVLICFLFSLQKVDTHCKASQILISADDYKLIKKVNTTRNNLQLTLREVDRLLRIPDKASNGQIGSHFLVRLVLLKKPWTMIWISWKYIQKWDHWRKLEPMHTTKYCKYWVQQWSYYLSTGTNEWAGVEGTRVDISRCGAIIEPIRNPFVRLSRANTQTGRSMCIIILWFSFFLFWLLFGTNYWFFLFRIYLQSRKDLLCWWKLCR